MFALLTGQFELINRIILESTKASFDLTLQIFPVIALWLGIMNIASVAGLLKRISEIISPYLGRLFPGIPKGHEALSLIASNIVINMFGLGNAATPFGLKAMKSLQTLNKEKDTASNSMVTFLIINTGGVTIIPTTVISMRMMYGSAHPTEIVAACIIATLISLIAGISIDYVIRKRGQKRA
ncbi:MAG: nucleoside recognition domain-containing protein [Bacilli bacterium]|nr:nucleoside recognition domain-containing protein [Bacilli bacterium]MDD4282945.1 nucleoside recognition domain-containing protein [Bacilli bacterium]MDD4718784.1 nucleoside recognition domain-containing protein [Bacilli bacterium]